MGLQQQEPMRLLLLHHEHKRPCRPAQGRLEVPERHMGLVAWLQQRHQWPALLHEVPEREHDHHAPDQEDPASQGACMPLLLLFVQRGLATKLRVVPRQLVGVLQILHVDLEPRGGPASRKPEMGSTCVPNQGDRMRVHVP